MRAAPILYSYGTRSIANYIVNDETFRRASLRKYIEIIETLNQSATLNQLFIHSYSALNYSCAY